MTPKFCALLKKKEKSYPKPLRQKFLILVLFLEQDLSKFFEKKKVHRMRK